MTLPRHTDVHIERLTLRGIALGPEESEQLRRVLETELAARLTAAPVNPVPLSTTRAANGRSANPQVGWTPGDPDRLGRDLGRVVHESLGP